MEFEFWAAVAFACMIAAAVIDWPRALAGLIWGIVGSFLPYGTLVVPAGVIAISAAAEFIYPEIGRSAQPSWSSFLIGIFSVAGTASSLYITVRNLKDRL
jgi:hypothetical protein